MPKTKPTRQSASSSKEPKAGLPHMPKDYGIKPRKKYLPWQHAVERLERSRNYWICSAGADGRPHAMPVWGFWIDDTLYFGTGRTTRKARNLLSNPAAIVHLESGDDMVVIEGTAKEITDEGTFAVLKKASQKKYGMWMPPDPKAHVMFAVRPKVALAWFEKTFPTSATRWSFE